MFIRSFTYKVNRLSLTASRNWRDITKCYLPGNKLILTLLTCSPLLLTLQTKMYSESHLLLSLPIQMMYVCLSHMTDLLLAHAMRCISKNSVFPVFAAALELNCSDKYSLNFGACNAEGHHFMVQVLPSHSVNLAQTAKSLRKGSNWKNAN